MRQGDNRAFERCDQRVALQGVGDAGCCADIRKAVEEMRIARLQRDEALLENSDRGVSARQPDQAARLTPQRLHIDDAARLIVVEALPPLAGLHVAP